MVSMHFENVIFPKSAAFHCRNCGACCKDQPPDINFKEQQRIEAAGYKNFMQDSSNPNNRNIRKKEDGGCFFFTRENSCEINSIKPSICILEPFVIKDYEYETGKIFLDLNPSAIMNCKGLSAVEYGSIEEIGRAAQAIVKDFSEIIAKNTGLPVTDKRVAALTKKLLRN
jgi:Fe-S-cluster containining protein